MVILKQQMDYYLINYLCPNLILFQKIIFISHFPFLIFLQPGLSFISSDQVTSLRFFQRKNGKHYQAAHQPLAFNFTFR